MGRIDRQSYTICQTELMQQLRGMKLSLHHNADSSFSTSESSFEVRETKPCVVQTTPESPLLSMKRSLRFSNNIQVHHVTHRKDLSKQDKKCIWYKSSEIKRMRKECQEISKLIQTGCLIQDDSVNSECTLGLDSETHSYARQRRLHKLMIRDLVFGEQHRQFASGLVDPDLLAKQIRALNSRCRHASFVSGLRLDRNLQRGFIN